MPKLGWGRGSAFHIKNQYSIFYSLAAIRQTFRPALCLPV